MDDVSPTGEDGFGLPIQQSRASSARLEIVSRLRSRGIGEHIDLPQIVVCGDQSAGKSSVLEGISGIPFPRQDGLCTRFPTEITMEHHHQDHYTIATIIPSTHRDSESKDKLRAYRQKLDGFDELPRVISEVGSLMGLRGYGGNTKGPSFGRDILRIKVCGQLGLHLTIVDLPGIIQVPNEEQNDNDVDTVHAVVDFYARNKRSIILAVVQAGNDIANQPIIRKSKKFDPTGIRTIGVITKPDLINEGTEMRIAALAKNQDTMKLRLGFFLLKNLSPSELASGVSLADRERRECQFFSTSPWSELGLSPDRTGIAALRTYLQDLLDQHTDRELPKVRDEMRKMHRQNEKAILELGEERPSIEQKRIVLSRLAMQYHALVFAASNGDYAATEARFFAHNQEKYRRLRAFVHDINSTFASDMRHRGKTFRVLVNDTDDEATEDDEDIEEDEDNDMEDDSYTENDEDTENNQDIEDDEDVGDDEDMEDHGNIEIDTVDVQTAMGDWSRESQIVVTEKQYKLWIKDIYSTTRGRELPGNYNHVLLTEMFHFQSRRWGIMASQHVENVVKHLKLFVHDVVHYITIEESVAIGVINRVLQGLSDCATQAEAQLKLLLDDERQQPITYNHYFTDNVQKARRGNIQRMVGDIMQRTKDNDFSGTIHVGENGADVRKLVAALQGRVTVDMDEQACNEARVGHDAYYKVAMKTFVDNVCRQVVERHLLRPLAKLFSPEIVAGYSDADLAQCLAESPRTLAKRRELKEQQAHLLKSLNELDIPGQVGTSKFGLMT